MHTTDPHHAEYLAAAAALHEQTPSPIPHEPAVGDFVSGETAGRRWQGRVEWVEGGCACINVGGGWVRVPLADVTH